MLWTTTRKVSCVLWCCVACGSVAAQTGQLPAREALDYTVEWRLVTAGKAQIRWQENPAGHTGWQANLHLESTGFVNKLFHVNDDYSSNLLPDLCTASTYMRSEEGRRKRETSVRFDRETRKAYYTEKDLVTNTSLPSHEVEIPACVHDVLGGLMFLRTVHLEPGRSTEVPASDGKKSVVARVEAQQREEVRTPAGNFKTIRHEIFLFNNVLYRRSGHLHVWYTDDARRLPVQIRVRLQFTIGTITLQLEKEHRP